MKLHYTKTPLRDLPMGSVVDGYKLTARSFTRVNAVAHRVGDDGMPAVPFEAVMLIHVDDEAIEELRGTK